MKKKTIMITSVLAVGLIGIAGYTASASFEKGNPEVKNEAIRIIEEEQGGQVTEVEYEHDDGQSKYEIEYNKDGESYEVDVDANSGKVMKTEIDDRDDDDWDDDRNDDRDDDVKKANNNGKKQSNIISTNKAIEIALQKQAGQVTEVELDEDDGKLIYEIEIETKKGEVEIEIDAKTGKILKVEFDD